MQPGLPRADLLPRELLSRGTAARLRRPAHRAMAPSRPGSAPLLTLSRLEERTGGRVMRRVPGMLAGSAACSCP